MSAQEEQQERWSVYGQNTFTFKLIPKLEPACHWTLWAQVVRIVAAFGLNDKQS
jgi:hypothetical protein